MSEAAPSNAGGERSGRGGFGRDRGGRGRGGRGDRGKPRSGASARAGSGEDGEWVPVTKLGRLVKAGMIRSLEEIFLHSLAVKEYQIIDHFLGDTVKDEVASLYPVQRQTSAGQRTRFKAYVLVGDQAGHIGIGTKTASEVSIAIRGAIWNAKTNIAPVRRGYWGLMAGEPHTVTTKVTGKAGSVRVRLVPAPRGTGLVASPLIKRVLSLAGISDVYCSSRGNTKTSSNFACAAVNALVATYGYLTPDLWKEAKLVSTPYEVHHDYLAKSKAGKKY